MNGQINRWIDRYEDYNYNLQIYNYSYNLQIWNDSFEI